MASVIDRKPQDKKSCDTEGSTAIEHLAYQNSTQKMVVTFTSGKSYTYFGVSRQRYGAFCGAPSKGKYFNAGIRNNYSYRRGGF